MCVGFCCVLLMGLLLLWLMDVVWFIGSVIGLRCLCCCGSCCVVSVSC